MVTDVVSPYLVRVEVLGKAAEFAMKYLIDNNRKDEFRNYYVQLTN